MAPSIGFFAAKALVEGIVSGPLLGFATSASRIWPIQRPNRRGLTLIALALDLGGWAHLMPAYGGRIAVALGVFAVTGTGYWLYEKGLFSPTPKGNKRSRL